MRTQIYLFQYKKEKSPEIIPNLQLWGFSKGLKNEFETAVVNEPSVFEPLKFYCIFENGCKTKMEALFPLKFYPLT